jgi:hypothetical protein
MAAMGLDNLSTEHEDVEQEKVELSFANLTVCHGMAML